VGFHDLASEVRGGDDDGGSEAQAKGNDVVGPVGLGEGPEGAVGE